uniref:GAGE domain-containing protein n=1 Tax=Bos indicus x Bos taurus TaxID=30522 RepID=A0A4W2FA88_BOBOX
LPEHSVRSVGGQVASKLGPTNQDCSQVDEPVVDQQPSVEQPQQEEPPKDPFEDSGLEADLQQLAEAKTGGEGGDGPDVREEFASNIEPVEMPEAGEGQPFA